MMPTPKPDSECLRKGGDATKCLYELLGNKQVDLKKRLPADGLFAFVQKKTMHLWKLKVNSGVGRGLLLVPKELSELSVSVFGLTVVTGLIGLGLAIVVTMACIQYASAKQRSFLKSYIAQGLFLHDEEQNRIYDRIQQEEIMKEEDDEECSIDVGSDVDSDEGDDGSSSESDDDESDKQVAKRRKERMELRLVEAIGREQGVLHFVTNQVNGTSGQQMMPSMDGAAMAVVGPTAAEKCWTRTKENLAHIITLALSCLPVCLLRFFFSQGIAKFGSLGLSSGLIGHGVICHVIQFMFVLSFALFNVLLLGLVLHYFFHEFDGQRFPWLKALTRSKAAKWLLVQWVGFSYVQAICFFISVFVLVIFSLNAAVGLMLHFFTNMVNPLPSAAFMLIAFLCSSQSQQSSALVRQRTPTLRA